MSLPTKFGPGEGLVGQCALEKRRILLPTCRRLRHHRLGLGRRTISVVLPVLFEKQTKAVVELASLHPSRRPT
jgi:hypothetical protein